MRNARTAWLLACGAIVALASCATEVTIRLPDDVGPVGGARRGEGRELLLAGGVSSTRPQRRCGLTKSSTNVVTGEVFCDDAPERVIDSLLSDELAAAGFKVLRDPGQAGPCAIALTVVLEQAFLEPNFEIYDTWTFETDLALRVTATTASGLVAQRRFYVKGEETTYWRSRRDMERSFESGARQLVASVVGALANLSEQFPAGPSP